MWRPVTVCPAPFVMVTLRKLPKLPGVPVIWSVFRCSPFAVCQVPPSVPMPETVSAPVPTYEMLYVPVGSTKPTSVELVPEAPATGYPLASSCAAGVLKGVSA